MKYYFNKEFVDKFQPCSDGLTWLNKRKNKEVIVTLKAALKDKKYDWCFWGLTRILTTKENVKMSIFSAELCLENYEKVYPNDDRVRNAIKAAKLVCKKNTVENRSAAWSAWSAARSAASAESAAWSAARSAAWSAARSAAWSAWSAARSAASAESAESAESAARSAWYAAESAESAESADIKHKYYSQILQYSISLINSRK